MVSWLTETLEPLHSDVFLMLRNNQPVRRNRLSTAADFFCFKTAAHGMLSISLDVCLPTDAKAGILQCLQIFLQALRKFLQALQIFPPSKWLSVHGARG